MTNAEEKRRQKAREMRRKKPIAAGVNLTEIENALWDISEDCYNIHWISDEDEILLSALGGDEEEAYEFRMGFADLEAQCDTMRDDLEQEWIPECFDIFFVAVGGGRDDGWLGYDTYEQDYYGISPYEGKLAEGESREKLKRMTKDQLIDAAEQCFRVYQQYISLKYRYDCLKSSMDILKAQNADLIQAIKDIEEAYDKADEDTHGFRICWEKESLDRFDKLLDDLPQEAWI